MNNAVTPDSGFEREKWKAQYELEREKWKIQQEFEREKWQAECANRDRDMELKDRELKLRGEEIDLKKEESRLARWTNPLVLAIFGATLAGLANIVVNSVNNRYQLNLEKQKSDETLALENNKSEATRILEMIKPGWKEGSENLRFLAETGLISNPALREKIKLFVDSNKSGPGPSLSSSLTRYIPTSEPNVFIALRLQSC